jgi:hypothetical protein
MSANPFDAGVAFAVDPGSWPEWLDFEEQVGVVHVTPVSIAKKHFDDPAHARKLMDLMLDGHCRDLRRDAHAWLDKVLIEEKS